MKESNKGVWCVANVKQCSQQLIEKNYKEIFNIMIGKVYEFYYPHYVIKNIHKLVLPRYLFIRCDPSIRTYQWELLDNYLIKFLSSNGVVHIVSNEEMELFKQTIVGVGTGYIHFDFSRGDNVMFTGGPFEGMTGVVDIFKKNKNRASISIEDFNTNFKIWVDVFDLKKR